jgi:hypothetical protein
MKLFNAWAGSNLCFLLHQLEQAARNSAVTGPSPERFVQVG